MVAISIGMSGVTPDLSVPGVVETHPFHDAPGWYVVLDEVGVEQFP